jgi:hypothetical protein
MEGQDDTINPETVIHTISKRQQKRYQMKGFDLRVGVVNEGNALRKEIKSVATEYGMRGRMSKTKGLPRRWGRRGGYKMGSFMILEVTVESLPFFFCIILIPRRLFLPSPREILRLRTHVEKGYERVVERKKVKK